MAKKKTQEALLEFPCTYKNLNVGDKTCNIGASVNKLKRPADDGLTLNQADGLLLGKRLTCTFIAKAHADSHPDQGTFPGVNDDTTVDAVVDVGGFSVKEENLSLAFTFQRKSVDVATLAAFAKKPGRVIVQVSEDIPDEDKAAASKDADNNE